MNDTTIEERVTILEFQMADLTEEVTDPGEDVDVIDGEVAVILADQVIQDERILELEADTEGDCVKLQFDDIIRWILNHHLKMKENFFSKLN